MTKDKKTKFAYLSVCILLIAVIGFGIFHYAKDFWKTRTINNFKVAATEFKSGKKVKLSKDEIELLLIAYYLEFADKLKQVQNNIKDKTKEEALAKIENFQMEMKKDLTDLLMISQYSLGEEDSATIKIKDLLNRLERTLKE